MAFAVYTPQTWTDGSSMGSAARFGVMEAGILNAYFQPAVRVFHSAAQSIASAVITTLAFNSERVDQAGNVSDTMHDNTTNNSRLTCRYAGVYLIVAQASWATTPSTGQIWIRHQGTTDIAASTVVANYTDMNITTVYPLGVNEFVEVRVQQSSGAAVNIVSSGNKSPEFMMVRVG